MAATVYAKHNNAQIGPKKVMPVCDLIRGKTVDEAKVILAFDPTKAAKMLLKVLNSAVANAKNNLNQDPAAMVVSEVYVNGGRMAKRWKAGARGRADPILKRSSHIVLGLAMANKEAK